MDCPICKRHDCFVSKMWNNNQLMDVLLAENGKDLYSSYEQTWIELLTHYFVTLGKTEVTVKEIKGAFQRNDFIPGGIVNMLLSMEDSKSITIRRPEQKKGWSSFFFQFFVSEEKLLDDSVIRCDYLLQHAAVYAKSKLVPQANTLFFLINCPKEMIDFLTSQQEHFPEMDSPLIRLTEACEWFIEDGQYLSSDYRNQAKQLLRNLKQGEDLLFAQYCEEKGIGHIFKNKGLVALVFEDGPKSDINLLKVSYINMIARYEKTIEIEKEAIERQRRKALELCANEQRDEAKQIMVVYYKPGKKRIFSLYEAVAALRKQLHTLDSAALSNTMMDIAEATNQVLPKALEATEKVAEMVEKMQEVEEMVKEAQDVIRNTNMSMMEEEPMDDAHLEQLLNEITTPPPPTITTTTASSPSGMQIEGTEQPMPNGMSAPILPLPTVEPTAPMPIHTMEL